MFKYVLLARIYIVYYAIGVVVIAFFIIYGRITDKSQYKLENLLKQPYYYLKGYTKSREEIRYTFVNYYTHEECSGSIVSICGTIDDSYLTVGDLYAISVNRRGFVTSVDKHLTGKEKEKTIKKEMENIKDTSFEKQ